MLQQRVKFFLVNSVSVEGIVLEENEDCIILTSSFGNKRDKVVIRNPATNIIMYIVFDSSEEDVQKPLDFDFEVPEEIQNLPEDLKLKKLAELKILQQQMHEEYVRKQMSTFQTPNIDDINNKYGYPTQLNSFDDSNQKTRTRKEDNFRKLRKVQRS